VGPLAEDCNRGACAGAVVSFVYDVEPRVDALVPLHVGT
jgi:hypothetical protein